MNNTKPITNTNSKFAEALEEAWVTDTFIAEGIYDIAENATKTIKDWDDCLVQVPDYGARVAALKLAMQSKWHLRPKAEKNDDPLDAIYVFVKN